MARAKTKMSAAERYRRIRQQQITDVLTAPTTQDETLYDFISPSGMEWKLRRPNLNTFIQNGVLPFSLAAKLGTLAGAGADKDTAQEAFAQLTPHDQQKAIAFTSALVRYIAVEPQIVEVPENDNQIGFDEVLISDYQALAEWASEQGGGDEAGRLGNFRSK